MCPLLWLVGAVFLFRPPTPCADLDAQPLPVYAKAEHARRISAYAAAEERWAKRCLWAWVAVLCVVSVAAGGVAYVVRGRA